MDRVRAAFEMVPRADFLPEDARHRAAYDGPIEIGHGATNSQPATVERMLRMLDVQPGDRVLDVGSGSGWTTALIAHLTGPDGAVIGVELEPALVEMGRSNLTSGEWPWAEIQLATPGVYGWPEGAPYQRILVSAEARQLPQELVDQLAPGGRMVVPVSGRMSVVDLGPDGPTVTEHGSFRFVPLR